MITIPPPVGLGRDTKKRAAARAALAAVLWHDDGTRKLPTDAALSAALEACDPRDVWWVCEASSAGPVYLLPTVEWIEALAAFLDDTKSKTVLEVAAGDGFLSSCLQAARPKLKVIATDDHSWTRARKRQSDDDVALYKGVEFAGIPKRAHVERMAGVTAVNTYKPDVVLVSWPPPGTLVDRLVRAKSWFVIDISVEGDVCGNGMKTWRFEKDFLFGPLEDLALCRLDARPSQERATRVTLYYGREHPQHHEDKAGARNGPIDV